VEQIDLYQFHEPDEEGTPVEDSWAMMKDLAREGKIRAGGVSNFGIPLLERCESQHHIDSVQPQFSLINRDAASDIIPWAARHGTGVIVYSPMGSGLLTERFKASRVRSFPADDWRGTFSPDFQEPALSRNLRLRDLLRPVAANRGTTVEAIALAWVLAWPGVTGAIAGARAPEQVDGWIAGSRTELTDEELTVIERAILDSGAGSGPAGS